ncbi:MAG: tRNA 2-selenouridine(34) synthase MnmH [Candidatus Azotimanducaceae bacterium WSBS_2022_MAG_OTU7]
MPSTLDMQRIFREDIPLIDVRAPVEFNAGAFPRSRNLPILDDTQREKVGICYAKSGPDAATSLGHELVFGQDRNVKVAAWLAYLGEHPDALLYCFRGGQRSRIACEWLKAEGCDVPRIEGGYKALRQCLLSVVENLPPLVIVAGKTGSGKTEFLQLFDQAIDLEGIANHRGSAFGRRITAQPTQLNFENELSIHLLKLARHPSIFVEDEGRLIGKVYLPSPLQEKMKNSPIVLLEDSVETRAERIYQEYIELQWREYEAHFEGRAAEEFRRYLIDAVDAIRKRLGNTAHGEIRGNVIAALRHQEQTGSAEGHLVWITLLLSDYYDPMYSYQLEKKSSRIKVAGSREVVTDWLLSNTEFVT